VVVAASGDEDLTANSAAMHRASLRVPLTASTPAWADRRGRGPRARGPRSHLGVARRWSP